MHEFHFKSLWHRTILDYIRKFSDRLATSEALPPYRSMDESAAAPVLPVNHEPNLSFATSTNVLPSA